ncbi:F-box associated domain containing protein, partial [Tanacetum coccineum]
RKALECLTHSFPPEIIREILLKATVKSLLRCKSVCKEWYSLISDQNFIKTHYTLSSTNNINYQHHRLIYTTEERENHLYIYPLYDVLFDKPAINVLLLKNPLQRTRALSIVGSCNGLVCLFVEDDDYDFFIYNPSTRIWNGLPFHRDDGYDYDYEPNWYSFGYDESTDDYKIVEMSTTKEVCIYSLKTGKWKIISEYSYGYTENACGIFSNGALHWVALDDSYHLVKDSWTKLASFPYLTHPWISRYPVPLFISNDGTVLIEIAMLLVIYKSKDSLFEYFDIESLVSPFPPIALADNNEY